MFKKLIYTGIAFILFCSTMLLYGCKRYTGIVYTNEIYDDYEFEYKLVLPFDNLTSMSVGGKLRFYTEPALSFADMQAQLEEAGYYVEANTSNQSPHLRIGFPVNGSYILCFILDGPHHDTDNVDRYVVNSLVTAVFDRESCRFPFPSYLTKAHISPPRQGEEALGQYGNFAETEYSYDDFIEFYNHSLTEIVEMDNENKSFVVKALGPMYVGFNPPRPSDKRLVKITYFEHEGKNYIGATEYIE